MSFHHTAGWLFESLKAKAEALLSLALIITQSYLA